MPLRGLTARKGRLGISGLILLAGLAPLLTTGLRAATQATEVKEYQVKAVFLFNFAEFVEWPPQSFPSDQSPLVIGILGDDPFGSYLDEAVKGERINNRPIVIQRYARVEDATACEILFISKSEDDRLDKILSGLKGRSILTVGDMDDFSQRGGMIRFVMANSKVRLKINITAAKAANLTISSKLLRPAEVVSTGRS
jgi:hypothetical protein